MGVVDVARCAAWPRGGTCFVGGRVLVLRGEARDFVRVALLMFRREVNCIAPFVGV